jgi:hypothetical protein
MTKMIYFHVHDTTTSEKLISFVHDKQHEVNKEVTVTKNELDMSNGISCQGVYRELVFQELGPTQVANELFVGRLVTKEPGGDKVAIVTSSFDNDNCDVDLYVQSLHKQGLAVQVS